MLINLNLIFLGHLYSEYFCALAAALTPVYCTVNFMEDQEQAITFPSSVQGPHLISFVCMNPIIKITILQFNQSRVGYAFR